jgi:hypothetical protein
MNLVYKPEVLLKHHQLHNNTIQLPAKTNQRKVPRLVHLRNQIQNEFKDHFDDSSPPHPLNRNVVSRRR